jgi:hypothetical protein
VTGVEAGEGDGLGKTMIGAGTTEVTGAGGGGGGGGGGVEVVFGAGGGGGGVDVVFGGGGGGGVVEVLVVVCVVEVDVFEVEVARMGSTRTVFSTKTASLDGVAPAVTVT